MSAADKIAEAKGLMPDRIWLLPCAGDEGETLWCEDPAPGAGMREEDAVGYVRADLADAQAQENAELRAENERLRNMALLARFSEVFAGSHRHLKSGGLYDHIGTGRIQSEQPLTDMDAVEIYIGVNGDLWARRQAEFHDGRFDEISPAIGDAP